MLRRLRLREQDNFDRLLRSISLVENRRNNQETEKLSTEKNENQTEDSSADDKTRKNKEKNPMLSPELKNRKRNEILDRQRFER